MNKDEHADPDEAFSGRAIQRQVLSEALQHPLTLYPFAASAITGAFAVFVAPFFGASLPALLVASGSGLAALTSFSWRYFVQGERAAREKARAVIAAAERQRREVVEGDLEERRAHLRAEFANAAFAEGRKALDELSMEYRELVRPFPQRASLDPISVGRLEASAAATFREGLDALTEALRLQEAIVASTPGALRSEIQELEIEIAGLQGNPTETERLVLKEEMLRSHRERLELLTQRSLNVERLLRQADLAEAALQRARLALPGLDVTTPEHRVQEVVADLDRTVEQAARVQRAVTRAPARHNPEDRPREAQEVR